MANGINPFDAFPFDKGTLETLLANRKLVDVTRKYFHYVETILHSDHGGEFRELDLKQICALPHRISCLDHNIEVT